MDFVSKNFIRLTLMLQEPTPTQQVDLPVQQLISVLAQWGGALGFWLGLSAMTAVELLELSFTVARITLAT